MRGRDYDFNTKKAPGITGPNVIVESGFMHSTKCFKRPIRPVSADGHFNFMSLLRLFLVIKSSRLKIIKHFAYKIRFGNFAQQSGSNDC